MDWLCALDLSFSCDIVIYIKWFYSHKKKKKKNHSTFLEHKNTREQLWWIFMLKKNIISFILQAFNQLLFVFKNSIFLEHKNTREQLWCIFMLKKIVKKL